MQAVVSSCCRKFICRLSQALQTDIHKGCSTFSGTRRDALSFFRQTKTNGFHSDKQKKWNIHAMKNIFIKIKKGMDSKLFSHWTCELIALLSTAFYYCRLIRLWSAITAQISSSASSTHKRRHGCKAGSRHPPDNLDTKTLLWHRKAGESTFLLYTEKSEHIPWDNYPVT